MSSVTAEKVIVVGAGPAGIAAAVQLKRCDIDPLVFEKGKIGGLLRSANFVENYPGFPEGINGLCLAKRLEQHLKKYEIRVIREEVRITDCNSGIFKACSHSGERETEYLVLSSGTKPRENSGVVITGDAEKRVHYNVEEITNLKGKRIVIVGAGDAAFDYAEGVSPDNDVLILGRSGSPRCLRLLHRRILANSKISYLKKAEIRKVSIKQGELLLELKKKESGNYNLPEVFREKDHIAADHILFAIGRSPRLDFLSEIVRKKMALLESDGRLFLAGDVINAEYRQVAISVGDGLRAAMKIAERIKAKS